MSVWDLTRGSPTNTLEGHSGPVRAVAITPDGRLALSGSDDGTVRIGTRDPGAACRVLIEFAGVQVNAVAVAPDGRLAVSASSDGTLSVWDLTWLPDDHAGGPLRTGSRSDHPRRPSQLARVGLRRRDCANLGTRDRGGLQMLPVLDPSLRRGGHARWQSGCLCVTQQDPPPRLGSSEAAHTTRELIASSIETDAVAFTPDGRLAVSGSYHGTLLVWDAANVAAACLSGSCGLRQVRASS